MFVVFSGACVFFVVFSGACVCANITALVTVRFRTSRPVLTTLRDYFLHLMSLRISRLLSCYYKNSVHGLNWKEFDILYSGQQGWNAARFSANSELQLQKQKQ